MSDALVVRLESARDLSSCGAKAARLGRLLRRGLPVPPGFVVTTVALRRWLEAGELAPRLRRLADEGKTSYRAAARAGREVQRVFAATALEGELEAALRGARESLLAPAEPCFAETLAVRSSAVFEDGPSRSWAGQLHSRLGVPGAGLAAAVRECWAGLWSGRAAAYAGAPDDPELALLVQRLVDAESAGVLFTADPVGAGDDLWVEATWGLGTSVVDGRASPDRWRLGRGTGEVLERWSGDKARQVRAVGEGVAELAVDDARRRSPALADAELAALARLGLEVEALFGAPQDIEWAFAGGRLFLLQARPLLRAFHDRSGSDGSELPDAAKSS